MSSVNEFRKRAEECCRLATTVSDSNSRAFWLRSAEDWMNVAAMCEKRLNWEERDEDA
jgi:hypothetical protein